MTDFRQRVAECNACIPYSGIVGNARVEDSALTAILSLLPVGPPAGANPPPPSTKEAIRTINILHCLQRLVTSASVAAAVLQTPGKLLSLPNLNCAQKGEFVPWEQRVICPAFEIALSASWKIATAESARSSCSYMPPHRARAKGSWSLLGVRSVA